eukprot:TRINITY_DN19417_c0_g1_i1.p1 TRINITY_DN19417_c0_g1~~TRINITY_DN19417_c0_g1_i1.p1  ORF type:complete len:277 (+),score=49.06 TRINITY_DN19417_c0_g1_i1:193-1023(+)
MARKKKEESPRGQPTQALNALEEQGVTIDRPIIDGSAGEIGTVTTDEALTCEVAVAAPFVVAAGTINAMDSLATEVVISIILFLPSSGMCRLGMTCRRLWDIYAAECSLAAARYLDTNGLAWNCDLFSLGQRNAIAAMRAFPAVLAKVESVFDNIQEQIRDAGDTWFIRLAIRQGEIQPGQGTVTFNFRKWTVDIDTGWDLLYDRVKLIERLVDERRRDATAQHTVIPPRLCPHQPRFVENAQTTFTFAPKSSRESMAFFAAFAMQIQEPLTLVPY